MGSAGIAAQFPEAATVSATEAVLSPASVTISPALACHLRRSVPARARVSSLVRRATSITAPSVPEHRHGLVRRHPAGEHAAAHQPAEKGVGLEQADQHAEGRIPVRGRRRHVRDDGLEQRAHVSSRRSAASREAQPSRAEVYTTGKSSCSSLAPKASNRSNDRFVHGLRPGIRAIHLADRHDRPEPEPQRLVDDELGLRHRALGRVHQDEDAIDHAEHALDLAAEVRVAGGVDNVDAHAAASRWRCTWPGS